MPSRHRERLNAALQLAAQGQLDQALSDLVAALSIAEASGDPQWISLFSRNIGIVAEQLGRWPDVVRYYRLACEIDPTDPHIHVALGQALTAIGQVDQARRALQHSIDLARARREDALADRAEVLLSRLGDTSGL